MLNNNTLKRKTISGVLWSSSDLIANQGMKFGIQIVLARLLMPEDFGIIGMITIFISVSQIIVDSGFRNALIREKDASQTDYSTVYYFNLVAALLMYVVLYFLAPTVSHFYSEPELVSIIRILALVIIINSFSLIQKTILIKKIDFKAQTKASIISSLVSGFISIVLALKGYGVWSLVVQSLAMQLIESCMLCFFNRWRPSLVFCIGSIKRLSGFSWKLLASRLIDTLYQNSYYLIIGRFFSPSTLGYYTNAQKLRDVASHSITTVIQRVSFPVLSSIQDDDARLRRGYRKIIRNSVFITFPLMIGLAVVAEPFIYVVFGIKWANSIPYFQILCIAGMFFPLHAINLNMLQVKGRSDLFLFLEILKKIIGVTLIAFVLFLHLGVMGLVWAVAINSVIAYFINSYFSANLLSYSTWDQIKDVFPAMMFSLLMGGIVCEFGKFMPGNEVIKLASQGFVGIISYIGISWIFKAEELKYLNQIVGFVIAKSESHT